MRRFLLLALVAAPAAADPLASCPAVTWFDPARPTLGSTFGDAPAGGIFDPSIVYPADAPAGAMAYSAVPDQLSIRTHVAVSTDHGASWFYAAEANAPELSLQFSWNTAECPGNWCAGNLISEVPSLVYDADDPDANARWKLFAHRYLVSQDARGQPVMHYTIGTITLQTAPAANGPWTAPAKWIGWGSPAPYSSDGVRVNATYLPGMSDCEVLSEPGALWLPGRLDLAVGCTYNDAGTQRTRIELLRSTDHAASFTRVATLLSPGDASCLVPGASISAPDLFVAGGAEYVAATPSDDLGYHGCLVFPVDVVTGTVERDPFGLAYVRRTILPTSGQFSGACTFAEGAAGYWMDLGFVDQPVPFRIAWPGVTVP